MSGPERTTSFVFPDRAPSRDGGITSPSSPVRESPLSQLPVQSMEYSQSESSAVGSQLDTQTPGYGMRYGDTFHDDGFSQSSQFSFSHPHEEWGDMSPYDTDEMTFNSQVKTNNYRWTTCSIQSSLAVPDYSAKILEKMRQNDSLYSVRGMFLTADEDAIERRTCIYWMVRNSSVLTVTAKAIHLAVRFLDRMIKEGTKRDTMQVVSAACLTLATKMEKVCYMQIRKLIEIADDAFTDEELVQAEINVCTTLDFMMDSTTVVLFMKMLLNELEATAEMTMAASFVAMCTLMSPQLVVIMSEEVALATVAITVSAIQGSSDTRVDARIAEYGVDRIRNTCALIITCVDEQLADEGSPIRAWFGGAPCGCVATKFKFVAPEFK